MKGEHHSGIPPLDGEPTPLGARSIENPPLREPELEVEICGLVKRFPRVGGWRGLLRPGGEKLALDNVNLSVRRGEVFGLLGPNGAGKTTLMKVLAGLLLPTAGEVYVAGLDVLRNGHDIRRHIGLVYGDERSFFWRLSAYENLRFYAALQRLTKGEAERRIWELLELVGLTSAAHLRMDRFSTGMKQRVAIARGLLNDPPILLMDEPTRALDPLGAHDIRQLIRQQVATGNRTVLLATNLLAEAEQLCDRLVLLNEGRICLTGTVAELRESVQFEEVHTICVDGIPKSRLYDLAEIPGVRVLEVNGISGERHEVKLGTARGSEAVPLVIRHLVTQGGNIWSCSPHEPSLQEIFYLAIRGDTQRTLTPTLVGGGTH